MADESKNEPDLPETYDLSTYFDAEGPDQFVPIDESEVCGLSKIRSKSNMNSDDSYSPPFSEDEDEDVDIVQRKPTKKRISDQEYRQHSEQCFLAIPNVPQIEGVIPFVYRKSVDEIPVHTQMIPTFEPSFVSSSTQTEPGECVVVNDNDCVFQRCRPICIVTQPPLPTSNPSSALNSLDDCNVTEFINEIKDDQLKPFYLEDDCYKVGLRNDDILKVQDCNNNCESFENESPTFFDDSSNAILPNVDEKNEDEDSSRKAWEKIASQFGPKHRKTNCTQRKSRLDKDNLEAMTNDNPIIRRTILESDPLVVSKPANQAVSESEVKQEDAAQICLDLARVPKVKARKSILKPSTNAEVQATEKCHCIGNTLPTNAAPTDVLLLESLRNKLQSLKQSQEKRDPNLNKQNLFNEFMLEILNSSTVPLSRAIQEQSVTAKSTSKNFKAVSQPNFQNETLSPGLKKVTFSEPQLTTRKGIKKRTSRSDTIAKTPSTTKKSKILGQEFTVGPPIQQPTQTNLKTKKNSKLVFSAAGISKKASPVSRPSTPVSPTSKVSKKNPATKSRMKNQSTSTTPVPFIINSPSPRKTGKVNLSGSAGTISRPATCPSKPLLGSSTAKVIQNKSQPTLPAPAKQRSKSIDSKKKSSAAVRTPKETVHNELPIRLSTVERTEKQIRFLKSTLKQLTNQCLAELKIKSTTTGSISSHSDSKASSMTTVSSKQASASTSETSIVIPVQVQRSKVFPKSTPKPRSMEQLKQIMLKEIMAEKARQIDAKATSEESDNNDDVLRTENVGGSTKNPEIIKRGLIIHDEVMEHVPLRSSIGQNGEDWESDISKWFTDNRTKTPIQRRVSFSDPIAVFKTMSPPSLFKPDEVFEDEDSSGLQLHRVQKVVNF